MTARRKTMPAIYICGGDYETLQDRGTCPNPLHDWPLPDGYGEAHEVAMARLRARWKNKRCPDCHLYGWQPSDSRPEATRPVQVVLNREEEP